jgi:hypothetical protein
MSSSGSGTIKMCSVESCFMLLADNSGGVNRRYGRVDGGTAGTSGRGIFGGGAGGPSAGMDFRGKIFGLAAKALPMMGIVVVVIVTGPLVVVVVAGRMLRRDE